MTRQVQYRKTLILGKVHNLLIWPVSYMRRILMNGIKLSGNSFFNVCAFTKGLRGIMIIMRYSLSEKMIIW